MRDDDAVWDGPIHGLRGVLADDGERAQCHICGGFYGNLGGHVRRQHDVGPADYKKRFGLKAGTGLVGPALKDVRRRQALARMEQPAYAAFVAAAKRAVAEMTPEQRSPRGRRRRLELRLDPARAANDLAALERANEVLAQRRSQGTYQPSGWGGQDPKTLSAKGIARLAELRADPAWRENFAATVSKARGGRLWVQCVVCGTRFQEPQSHRRRKTCGDGCWRELNRRIAREQQEKVAADREERRRLGQLLAAHRRAQGLSLERTAALTGLSASHLSCIERGLNTPSTAALHRIAKALGTTIEALEGAPQAG